ncbi:MAG: cyclic nucleotide-binding/CBS domain-containing protein [Candidatus Limnocylindrales bacterium]
MSSSPKGAVRVTTARSLHAEKVTALASREPLTVDLGTPVAAVIQRMRAARGEPALILRDGRLAGIFTERDVLLKVLGHDVPPGAPVDDYMKRDPHAMTAEATLGEAAHLMDRGRFRHVPIVDGEGRPLLTLRQQDILAYIAEAFPAEILNLPPRPHQRLAEPEGA